MTPSSNTTKCPNCGRAFENPVMLEMHMGIEHGSVRIPSEPKPHTVSLEEANKVDGTDAMPQSEGPDKQPETCDCGTDCTLRDHGSGEVKEGCRQCGHSEQRHYIDINHPYFPPFPPFPTPPTETPQDWLTEVLQKHRYTLTYAAGLKDMDEMIGYQRGADAKAQDRPPRSIRASGWPYRTRADARPLMQEPSVSEP